MRAILFDGELRLVEDHPNPQPGPDEALVAVRCAGVCSTDLEILAGYMGFAGVLGHELVGDVVAGPAEWLGRRVVAEINAPCGACPTCLAGRGNHCPQRTVVGIHGRDGAFAEQVAVPVGALHAVPPSISDDQAVFVEPLAAALRVVEQAAPGPSERAVVLGDGRLGQLVAQVLASRCPVQLVGRHDTKLSIAERLGVPIVRQDDFAADGEADLVVDATGSAAGFELAMQAVRPLGRIVLKSTCAEGKPLNLAPLVVREVTVIGSRCGPFPAALQALARGEVQVEPLISRRYPLREGVAALTAARGEDVVKVLIDVAGATPSGPQPAAG